jgi:endonuclease-3
VDQFAEKTQQVAEVLEEAMGIPVEEHPLPPLDNLILTMLSQNTNDRNRDIAYERLRKRFPSWEQVMQADTDAVIDAIRPAGLSNQKGKRIQELLRWVQAQYGALNLDVLCTLDPQEAMDTFCQRKGIGVKTMAVVLTFSCGKDVFPVDTHVHRLCKRIGLVPPDTSSAEKTFYLMRHRVPKGKAFSFHLNLINHGRTICKARKPLCEHCPLTAYCNYYATERKHG